MFSFVNVFFPPTMYESDHIFRSLHISLPEPISGTSRAKDFHLIPFCKAQYRTYGHGRHIVLFKEIKPIQNIFKYLLTFLRNQIF